MMLIIQYLDFMLKYTILLCTDEKILLEKLLSLHYKPICMCIFYSYCDHTT